MVDRRVTDRRNSLNTPEDPLGRERERRAGDRRDSPRFPMTFLVREQGDLSIGGIHWKAKTRPKGPPVEVRFRLPGVAKELRASGEIIRLSDAEGEIGFHVRFTELDLMCELAIAKYLDDMIAEGTPAAKSA